ncbi:MAG TPA: M28 family peptidase [Chloroflexota bacterium]|nr:M28 family peptidase [Chloroflexota bacterium]
MMVTTHPASFVTWSDQALERTLLDQISLTVPWSVVERFSSLVRLSGSPQEREAFTILTRHLDQWGVPYTLHEPEAFISIPLAATVRVGDRSFRAKTPAMSVSTGGQEISGELVYMPSSKSERTGDVFSAGVDLEQVDVRGKVVLSEGMAAPGKLKDVMAAGALAGIFINPGEAIHEGICTTIWGTPDLASMDRQPTIPVIAVNHPDGQELIALARQGAQVALSTTLDTGWRHIPVLVAEIPGAQLPDEFVLLHGHLDSWHVGIGDNATGDATMLELARVFWQHRDRLTRSLRIAWWSGHSHGRYAGSTWYADHFGIDLARHCVAQVNCDSPGCRWADTFNGLNAMSEAEPFVDAVVRETTGITPQMERPHRAGDYSFNSIGITSFYMLSSTMSDEARAQRGYYAVGGCGGNIQWHTEADTMEIADQANLLRDMRMYAGSVLRTLNAPLHPFDWTQTTAEFHRTLDAYSEAAGDVIDLKPSYEELAALERALQRLYAAAPSEGGATSAAARRFNFAQRRLARLLVRVNFSELPSFYHDPALSVPQLPDLAPALRVPAAGDDIARRGILHAHLTRGQNRLVWTLQQAREVVEGALQEDR